MRVVVCALVVMRASPSEKHRIPPGLAKASSRKRPAESLHRLVKTTDLMSLRRAGKSKIKYATVAQSVRAHPW